MSYWPAPYGPDTLDPYRRAVAYVDRILRERSGRPAGAGADEARTGDQLKTAKALGLTVPPTLLARADEVIE